MRVSTGRPLRMQDMFGKSLTAAATISNQGKQNYRGALYLNFTFNQKYLIYFTLRK